MAAQPSAHWSEQPGYGKLAARFCCASTCPPPETRELRWLTNTADIRQFLTERLQRRRADTLCSDYFRDVYDNFAAGMTKTAEDPAAARSLPAPRADAQPARRAGAGPAGAIPEAVRAGGGGTQSRCSRPARPRSPPGVHQPRARGCRVRPPAGGRPRARGWRVWIAPDSIRPGEKWVDAIERGSGGVWRVRCRADAGRGRDPSG